VIDTSNIGKRKREEPEADEPEEELEVEADEDEPYEDEEGDEAGEVLCPECEHYDTFHGTCAHSHQVMTEGDCPDFASLASKVDSLQEAIAEEDAKKDTRKAEYDLFKHVRKIYEWNNRQINLIPTREDRREVAKTFYQLYAECK
jgi:hypothetical protein